MNAYAKGRDALDDDLADLAVEVFRLLADGTRIRLLWALSGGELTVSALAQIVGKAQPSVSQHLAKLRMARLVRARRDGLQVYYSLQNEHIERLVTDAVLNAEHAMPGLPVHHGGDQSTECETAGGGE
ncbi:MAG: metalloregulator ArsR/SmtB family transcription factor [Propionibacteriaceae bacterium]|jgi:DNA-binding transcriptional ArsR family regulator|nr:metalloregulator ArsR/SmtB family transcription factor [Propionibacteriaceae bacterium]